MDAMLNKSHKNKGIAESSLADPGQSGVNEAGTGSKIDTPLTQPRSGLVRWEPIETAPRMKTLLLFAVTDMDDSGVVLNWRMATGAWHTGWENDERNSPWEWGGRQLRKYETQPTHWMTLPDPPSP